MKEALVVNLFGVPCAGKSTGAAYIFYKLKTLGLNVELVTEFAKDKVWEQNDEALKNQAYIFGQQTFRLSRCVDKVDVVITDSPLPLSIIYNKDKRLTENFNKSVMDVFNSYENINYLLHRVKPYNQVGRLQSEQEAKSLERPVFRLLEERSIPYKVVGSDTTGYDIIVKDVIAKI